MVPAQNTTNTFFRCVCGGVDPELLKKWCPAEFEVCSADPECNSKLAAVLVCAGLEPEAGAAHDLLRDLHSCGRAAWHALPCTPGDNCAGCTHIRTDQGCAESPKGACGRVPTAEGEACAARVM